MVWTSATVAGVIAVTMGAGWALGDLSKIVGGGLSAAGQPAAVAASELGDLAKEGMTRQRGVLDSFLEEGLINSSSNRGPAEVIRSRRELGLSLMSLFGSETNTNASAQQAVVTQVMQSRGISEADARKLVDEWTASYQRLKTELQAAKDRLTLEAKEKAQAAAKTLAILSLCSFVAFLIGAFMAAWGGKCGGTYAVRRALTNDGDSEVRTSPALPPTRAEVPVSH